MSNEFIEATIPPLRRDIEINLCVEAIQEVVSDP